MTALSAWQNFVKVARLIGLRPPAAEDGRSRGPRLHDLRHRFAVATLIHWYRAGADVDREIPKLATYLGHEGPTRSTGICRPFPNSSSWRRSDPPRAARRWAVSAPTFAALLQGFFTDRLLRQMRASPNTVSGYRDAFRLLIRYAAGTARKRALGPDD